MVVGKKRKEKTVVFTKSNLLKRLLILIGTKAKISQEDLHL